MDNNALVMFSRIIRYKKEYIWIKPVCDFFQISYQNQTRKIKSDPILANQWTKMSSSLLFGDNYPRILLTKKGFIRWIQLINVNTIVESLQEKFQKFQELVFDFLYGHALVEKQAKIDYARLKRLKTTYAKIGREIQRVEKGFNTYLENKFVQFKLELPDRNDPE